jgi:hypothetical protein
MNANRNYRRQTNADLLAWVRRMGKARSVLSSAGLIRRFRCFVTETNWDQNLCGLEKWIDLFSWTVIASSLLFFIPVTLSVFGK